MTDAQAIHEFMSGFGIPAYPVSSVPEVAPMPYLSYDLQTSSFEMGDVQIAVNLWYYSTSEVEINAKAAEIGDKLGQSGTVLWCDNGAIWLKRGHPWAQSIRQRDDANMKRRYLIINADYNTK